MRRVLCVWCPLWPMQRLLAEQLERTRQPIEERSIVLFAESSRGLHVTCCSSVAARQGIRIGMPLGEAQSLLQGTSTYSRSAQPRRQAPFKPAFQRADPEGDRIRLRKLALDCQRYSPLVGLEDVPEPESLWLDISGNESLFGGEQGLIEALQADLARQGFRARMAIADTWGAAWAVAQFGKEDVHLVPPGQQALAIASLPVAALRVPEAVIDSLRILNVSTIGRLMQLPRTALPSRFGKELLRRLDQALGILPELLPVERLAEPLSVEWLFEEPVADRQTLEHVLGVLLDQILGLLNDRGVCLREIHCHWLGTTNQPLSLRLLRPTTDRRHLFELLRLQCERCRLTTATTGVRMQVIEMGLPAVRQSLLFEESADKTERQQRVLSELVDRLDSRLGRQAVLRPRLRPDPQPEYACDCVSWLDDQAGSSPEPTVIRSHLRCRPLCLFRSPRPLAVDKSSRDGPPVRVNHSPIIRSSGPERIETGWWRGLDSRRDYYRLDLTNGASLWAFVDRTSGGWFLHGLFA